MIGWYIGEILTLVLVVPVLIFYLNKLVRPALEIKAYVDDVLQHGVGLTGTLDAVPKLVETRDLSAVALEQVGRYGGEIVRILTS
ncbi:MAG: hypothetical protein ACRDX8_07640 [Acidimicrobiales bacterium]